MNRPSSGQRDVTQILAALSAGDSTAVTELMPVVYDELRALAGSFFRHQAADHTLQPTALVHEVFLRLVQSPNASWNDRRHFFRVAAQAMRQILADHARRERAERRGGAWSRVVLQSDVAEAPGDQVDLVAFDDALARLAELDARQGQIVELRFLAGLSVDETAVILEVSPRTVELDSRLARAWLQRELSQGGGS